MVDRINLTNKIPIIGDYYAGTDAYQWILLKRIVRKIKRGENKGSPYEDFEACGYHASIASLCQSVLKKYLLDGVSGGELKSLREVIEKSEEIEREIQNAVGNKF